MKHNILFSGHRRVTLRAYRIFSGEIDEREQEQQDEQATEGKVVAILARISSASQATSMTNQIEMLEAYAREHYPNQPVKVYKDVCSSLKKRDNLCRLQLDVIRGRVSTVLAKDISRISRLESEYLMFKTVLDHQKVKMVFVSPDDDDSDDRQEFCNAVLRIITCYAAKESSRKSAIVRSYTLSDPCKKLISKNFKAGVPLVKLPKIIFEAGFRNKKGGKISSFKVTQFVMTEFPDKVEQKISGISTLEEFLASGSVFFNQRARIKSKVFFNLYRDFCIENDYAIPGKYKTGLDLAKMDGVSSIRPSGCRWWVSIGQTG